MKFSIRRQNKNPERHTIAYDVPKLSYNGFQLDKHKVKWKVEHVKGRVYTILLCTLNPMLLELFSFPKVPFRVLDPLDRGKHTLTVHFRPKSRRDFNKIAKSDT